MLSPSPLHGVIEDYQWQVSVSISVSTRACHSTGRAKAGFDSPTESFFPYVSVHSAIGNQATSGFLDELVAVDNVNVPLMITRLGLAPIRAVARTSLPASSPRVYVLHRAASTSAQQPARSLGRTTAYASLFLVSTGLLAVYYFDCRAALHKYVVTPVIRHTLDAEAGHKLAVRVLSSGLAPRDPVADDEILKVEVRAYIVIFFYQPFDSRATQLWDEELANPVGLAAGFDKHAEAIDGSYPPRTVLFSRHPQEKPQGSLTSASAG